MAVANVWDKHRLKIDEPSWLPIGTTWLRGRAYLLVGCAGCQVEVITQALQKARVEDYDISVEARFETEELGPELEEYPDHLSWRYTTIALDIDLATSEENEAKVERLLDLVEDAYIVSRSVERSGGFEISKVLSTIRLFSESDDGTNYLSSWRTARSPFAPRPPVVFGFGSINP